MLSHNAHEHMARWKQQKKWVKTGKKIIFKNVAIFAFHGLMAIGSCRARFYR